MVGIGRLELVLQEIDGFQAFLAVFVHFLEIRDGPAHVSVNLVAVFLNFAQVTERLLGRSPGLAGRSVGILDCAMSRLPDDLDSAQALRPI